MDSEDELPNAHVETSLEGEHSNEHPANLTETEASKQASEPGKEYSFSAKPDLKETRQIQQRFANVSTALKSLVSE
jgi:hypothetical protein